MMKVDLIFILRTIDIRHNFDLVSHACICFHGNNRVYLYERFTSDCSDKQWKLTAIIQSAN